MRVYFTLGRSTVKANSVIVTVCIVGVSLAGRVHSGVNKPHANGRVSYDSLTHSRLYRRDGEKVGHELNYCGRQLHLVVRIVRDVVRNLCL